MTWSKQAPPSSGSRSQFVTLTPVQDATAGIDFQLLIRRDPTFVVSSDCPVLISSTTITEP